MNGASSGKLNLIISVIGKILPLLIRIAPFLLAAIVLIKIIVAFIPAGQAFLLLKSTDSAAAALTGSAPWIDPVKWLLLIAVLSAVRIGLEAVSEYMSVLLKQRFEYRLEEMLAHKAANIPLILFDQADYYDTLQRAKSNISVRGFRLLELILTIVECLFTLAGYIVLLTQFSWLLIIALIAGTIPTLLVHLKIGEWNFWLQRYQTPYVRRLVYLFELLTQRFAAKELRIYRLAPAFLKEWGDYYWKNAREQRKVDKKSISTRSGIDGWNTVTLLAYSVYVLWVCFSRKLSLGTFVAVSQILSSTQAQMKNVAYSLSQFYEESMIIQEFFTFMDTEEEHKNEDKPAFTGKVQEGISVNNLSFTYPGSTKPALNNISFRINKNETVAIVGENGAGKSTLIHCLIGLHQSYEGSITYDHTDLKDINVASFRNHVSAVFQDYVHYHGSVKENIGFGNVERIDNLAAIEAAAGLSGAAEFIDRLPNSYNTQVGAGFQNAQELSIGQWQKLALGRAYFNDGSIVVLDEPTASLDPTTESELYRQFHQLSEGKVTFLVSHRLGSCRIADRIVVLKQGELVEQGTHDELMKLGGEYKQMYESQAEWYLQEASYKGA
ncbi:hypothetical protein A7K91_00850 [Paenibacillus oryzae]|uniref:ABC transporter ATP-binding protein n=1 Tax=Paenibacillus oryzae TaxID=1844972 RepID=A0A1A5YA02_9BACL|nr:ABC transporter ATP-binding protein [Paenibacillus oryzae]OBR62210.1 hypothetical protein A7K91_00850 [Paenibacillus oryzae]